MNITKPIKLHNNACLNVNQPVKLFDISIKKLARYIFPKIDPIPSAEWYTDTRIPPQILEDLIFLSCDKLSKQEYEFWSTICARDVLFKEVSLSGIHCTGSEIKREISNFKKSKEKEKYVKAKYNPKIQTASIQCISNYTDSKYSNEKRKCTGLNCECNVSKIDLTYSDKCIKHVKDTVATLSRDRSRLQNCISQALKLNLSKKILNKLIRFEHLLSKDLKWSKFNYYCKVLLKAINIDNMKHDSYSVHTISLPDPNKQLPYIFGNLVIHKREPEVSQKCPILPLLCDSGAELNILSLSHLKTLGISQKILNNSCKYNIKSSTELKKDAIMGTINLTLYLAGENGHFGRVQGVMFLVAKDTVALDEIILSTQFFQDVEAKFDFGKQACHIQMKLEGKSQNKICMQMAVGGLGNEKIALINKSIIIPCAAQKVKFIAKKPCFVNNMVGNLSSNQIQCDQPLVTLQFNNSLHFAHDNQNVWPVKVKADHTFMITVTSTEEFRPDSVCLQLESLQRGHGDMQSDSEDTCARPGMEECKGSSQFDIPEILTQDIHTACQRMSAQAVEIGDKESQREYCAILRTKIANNLGESEEDIVQLKDQNDMSGFISQRLDRLNIIPEEPGNVVNLSHLRAKPRELMNKVINQYESVFSKSKFDIGKFTGFSAKLSVQEGKTSFEPPRKLKQVDEEQIYDTMDNLIKVGIFSKARTGLNSFASNLNLVDKPEADVQNYGKADKYLNKQNNIKGNKGRATIDMRGLNKIIIESPKIELPTLEFLQSKVRNCHVTSLDLTQMFFSIPLSEESKQYCNFWYRGQLYTHNFLPQGCKLSPFIGQKAQHLTFSEERLRDFLNLKGWEIESDDFPFLKWSDFVIFYQDDVALWSSKSFKEAELIHSRATEAVLFALHTSGWKLSKKKCVFMADSFTFLGIEFSTVNDYTSMIDKRVEGVQKWRNPHSQAECLSRLAVCNYFSSHLPLLRKITAPLHVMCQGENFRWGEIESKSWANLKQLISLKIRNYHIDPTKPLFVTTDSSQIAIAFMAFQVSTEGEIRVVCCDSKLLQVSDRNKAASFRELLALMYSVLKLELKIRNHPLDVVFLTDCVSLQFLHRTKYHNSRLLEFALFLSTFNNISVNYSIGKSLYFADALTRGFNQVYLKDGATISREWGTILPPIKGIEAGTRVNPRDLVDFIISRPRSELLDCFSKSSYYSQNLERYHVLEQHKANIPAELSFLSDLYTGWNKSNLTELELADIDRTIRCLPVESLSKKCKNLNLKKLRQKLFQLNMHDEFMKILARKYDLEFKPSETPATTSQNSCDKVNISSTLVIGEMPRLGQASECHLDIFSKYSLDELLERFNLDKSDLQSKLEKLLQTFSYLLGTLDRTFKIQTEFDGCQTQLEYLLKLLLRVSKLLCEGQVTWGKQSIVPLQYYLEEGDFIIDFNNNSFNVLAKQSMTLKPFEIRKIQGSFLFKISKLMSFEANQNLSVTCYVSMGVPNIFNVKEVILHNHKDTEVYLPANTVFGTIELMEDNNNVTIAVEQVPEKTLTHQYNFCNEDRNKRALETLSGILWSCLKNEDDKLEKIESKQDKEIHLTKLMKMAKVDPGSLPKNKKQIPLLLFEKHRNTLNKILLCQNLMASDGIFSEEAVGKIQRTCSHISSIIQKVVESPNGNMNDFVLHKNILYKKAEKLGVTYFRLALPEFLSREILHKLHSNMNLHLDTRALLSIFSGNFWTRHTEAVCKKVTQSCGICVLQKESYKRKIKGTNRSDRENVTPGSIYFMDVAYLPKSTNGFKYAVILVERLTGYIAALPVRALTTSSMISAVRAFFSVLSLPEKIGTDSGPEFRGNFSEELLKLGVQHVGSLPRRSQSQGSAERGILLLKNQLSKLCAMNNVGRKRWPEVLPQVIFNINSTHPYGLPLSRTQLLFSPMIHSNTGAVLHDPTQSVKVQRNAYVNLNNQRLSKLAQQKISATIPNFKVGNFVLLDLDNPQTVEGSKQLIVPKHRDTYKIISTCKQGFQIRLLNLRNGEERTVGVNKIRKLNLEELFHMNIDPFKAFSKCASFKGKGIFKPGSHETLTLVNDTEVEDDQDDTENSAAPGKKYEESKYEEQTDIPDFDPNSQQPARYNLRPRNVCFHQLKLCTKLSTVDDKLCSDSTNTTKTSEKSKQCLKRSILKQKNSKGLDFQLIFTLDNAQIKSMKKAIKHSISMKTGLYMYQKILDTNFGNGSITRYDLPADNYKVPTGNKVKIKEQVYILPFNKSRLFGVQTRDLNDGNNVQIKLSLINIIKSTFFSTSLKEMQFCRN